MNPTTTATPTDTASPSQTATPVPTVTETVTVAPSGPTSVVLDPGQFNGFTVGIVLLVLLVAAVFAAQLRRA